MSYLLPPHQTPRMNPHAGHFKALADGFNIHSILLNAVEKLLNDVERWDGQTVSTFHSTKLSEWLGNQVQAPALCTHARAPFGNDTMDRAYVYNKVRSLLEVFVDVLNDEDKKNSEGERQELQPLIAHALAQQC